MLVWPFLFCRLGNLTLAVVAVANSLAVVEGSHRPVLMGAACCMHSWEVRMSVEEEAGWGLRRRRVQGRRRLLPV